MELRYLEKVAWKAWEKDQATNPDIVNPHAFIYGFVMGVGIRTVLNLFFGTSQGSANKSKQIEKVLNGGTK